MPQKGSGLDVCTVSSNNMKGVEGQQKWLRQLRVERGLAGRGWLGRSEQIAQLK